MNTHIFTGLCLLWIYKARYKLIVSTHEQSRNKTWENDRWVEDMPH